MHEISPQPWTMIKRLSIVGLQISRQDWQTSWGLLPPENWLHVSQAWPFYAALWTRFAGEFVNVWGILADKFKFVASIQLTKTCIWLTCLHNRVNMVNSFRLVVEMFGQECTGSNQYFWCVAVIALTTTGNKRQLTPSANAWNFGTTDYSGQESFAVGAGMYASTSGGNTSDKRQLEHSANAWNFGTTLDHYQETFDSGAANVQARLANKLRFVASRELTKCLRPDLSTLHCEQGSLVSL